MASPGCRSGDGRRRPGSLPRRWRPLRGGIALAAERAGTGLGAPQTVSTPSFSDRTPIRAGTAARLAAATGTATGAAPGAAAGAMTPAMTRAVIRVATFGLTLAAAGMLAVP